MADRAYEDGRTVRYRVGTEGVSEAGRILREVYRALEERGYHPVNQIVGYLLSGDPTYITPHRSARRLIRGVERDELLEELIEHYIHSHSASRRE